MEKDLTPEAQAEYEAELAKKARTGKVLAIAVCGADLLLGVLSGSFVCAFAAVLLLVLTVFGRTQAKWLAVGLGGFYAVLGAMSLIDLPAAKVSEREYYVSAGWIELAHGIISAVLFMKLPHIRAYFEHKTAINRKTNF